MFGRKPQWEKAAAKEWARTVAEREQQYSWDGMTELEAKFLRTLIAATDADEIEWDSEITFVCSDGAIMRNSWTTWEGRAVRRDAVGLSVDGEVVYKGWIYPLVAAIEAQRQRAAAASNAQYAQREAERRDAAQSTLAQLIDGPTARNVP